MYLYFNEKIKKIIASVEAIEKEGFTPLNEEQITRWRSNPKVHWSQIMNAPANVEVPTIAEPTLEELKSAALKKLSDLSLEILGSHISEYQMMNALLSLNADLYDKIYDDDKSQDFIDIYLEVGNQCRRKFYDAKEKILQCDTKEELKAIEDEYTDQYNQLRKK